MKVCPDTLGEQKAGLGVRCLKLLAGGESPGPTAGEVINLLKVLMKDGDQVSG